MHLGCCSNYILFCLIYHENISCLYPKKSVPLIFSWISVCSRVSKLKEQCDRVHVRKLMLKYGLRNVEVPQGADAEVRHSRWIDILSELPLPTKILTSFLDWGLLRAHNFSYQEEGDLYSSKEFNFFFKKQILFQKIAKVVFHTEMTGKAERYAYGWCSGKFLNPATLIKYFCVFKHTLFMSPSSTDGRGI